MTYEDYMLYKSRYKELKSMLKRLKETMKQTAIDDPNLADMKAVYQNTTAERDRVKELKKIAKSHVK